MPLFPRPFGGIEIEIRLTGLRPATVLAIICGTPKKDGGCGHKHNFAYASSDKLLYVSRFGAACVARVLDERRRQKAKG